ncbi:hypothetical protein KSS87_022131 [Heliosperma pusillum]|nr:hypothetical protein KSS87_022131 [Heliosperma pusillum]
MDSRTRLDYVLFHLTPTRTRCDLVIFAEKSNEKLAYGLLEPFIAHLRSAKDQISKGGYSVTLRPPSPENSHWFTKGTLQRFVRFVSTPEILERFVTIEREISQLDNSIKSFEASNVDAATEGNTVGGNSKTSTASIKSYGESNDSSDLIQEENSKDRLHRVVETRKVVLWKEQAMVYARALAAGFDLDNLNDLLSFSDAFGASRLREACINFRDLCNKKNEDRLWVDEIAAMQAIMQPDLSLMGASGIVLAGEDIDPDTVTNHDSTDANQASQSPGLMQNPWASQFPPHKRNFQGPVYQQMPLYQGYGFPGMQVAPPYYPANMPWPADVNGFANRDSQDHRDRKSSSNKKSKASKARKSGNEGHDEKTEPSESSSETDTSSDRSHRKKNGKKSSRKVVIRNINYISAKKDDEKNSASETSSSDEKHHKSSATAQCHKKDNESKKVNKGSDGWDAFQQLLLKEESDSNVLETKTAPTEEEYLSAKISEKQQVANDGFIVTEMGSDGYHPAIRRGTSSIPEEFQFAQRSGQGESYAQVSLSNDAARSVIKSHTSDYWFVSKNSDVTVNQGESGHFRLLNGDNLENRSKDVVIDDSLMIQGRLADEHSAGHMRTNVSMVSDIMEAREAAPQKIPESQAFCEPDELYMALDRDIVVEQTVPSWNPEIDFENDVSVNNAAKEPDIDACADSNANKKGANKKTGNAVTKGSGKDARSRTAGGPMRRGKPETTPGPRRSTFGSKTANPKSQLQKDEERRKRMEELLIRRQKRIAERGGDSSTSGRKSVTSSLTSDKLKRQPSVEETKKPKPVLRSSTIDRLAVAKTTKNSSTPQPKRETSNPKGTNTNNGSQKTRDVHLKKLSANKINLLEKKRGNGDPTGVKSSAADGKEAKNPRMEIKFDEADDSKVIKELHVTSTAVSTDVGMVVKSLQTIPSVETVDKSPLACPEDVKVSDENEKISPELNVHPVPESPTKHLNSALIEDEGIANRNISETPEISVVQESTPMTTSETVLESTQSRKKWDGPEKSPKAKGFRKLLMFGRKS